MSAALIYLRVSTKKQEQRNELNLPTQQKKCEDWCRAEAIPVLKVFTGHGESAWKTERPTLDEALDFIKKSKGAVTHFVVQDTTRFSRNDEVKAVACAVLKKLGVTLVSVDEPMLNDSPTGKLTGTMLTALGEFYSHSLSSRVRYRFQVHRESGRWMHQAPIGYHNVTRNGMKTLEPDAAAPLLRQAFEMIATGNYSSGHVRKLMTASGLRTKKGHKLGRQTFSYTLKNPLYCGVILHKGKRYEGTFQKLISEETWNAAQDALSGRRKAVPKKPTNEQWPLRGFVRCGTCGEKMTSGNAKGRYPKYWCHSTTCKDRISVSKMKLESDWLDFLVQMQPAFDALVNHFPVLAKAHHATRTEANAGKHKQLAQKLAEKKALNVTLITAKVKNEISQEDFDTVKAALAEEIGGIEKALGALDAEAETIELLTIGDDRIEVQPATLWASAKLNERQTVQSALFPEGVLYRPENGFFVPNESELQAVVLKCLAEIADHPEAHEILNGRDDWI